jgi:hypothetical protein
VSSTSSSFGAVLVLTASTGSTTGTVTFSDVASSGPNAGVPVTVRTSSASAASTGVPAVLPAFGTNTITASFAGAVSAQATVQVSAVPGSVLVNQFRLSGPGGPDDSFVELYNATETAVPLAGFEVRTSSGGVVTLPPTAPTLPSYGSFLVTGGAYSLGTTATSDVSATSLGSDGVKLMPPDGTGLAVDAAGGSGTYAVGTALPVMTGSPMNEHAWVRHGSAGRPANSANNAADFTLVSTTGGSIGGVASTVGTPSPRGSSSPMQSNATMQSALLDPAVGSAVSPNRSYTAGSPGTLVIRRTITNDGPSTVTLAHVRVTALSQANGAPQPGVATQPPTHANLRVVNPALSTGVSTVSGGIPVTVKNLSLDLPATSGGGLGSTLAVPLPAGLAPGESVNIAITFAVDQGGPFWFGYDVDAK